MSEEKFYLYGFVDFFHVIPNFIYPLFRKGKNYYFQNGDTDSLIDMFVKTDINYINECQAKLIKIDELVLKDDIKRDTIYYTGKSALYAVRITNEMVLWGDVDFIINKLKSETKLIENSSLLRKKMHRLLKKTSGDIFLRGEQDSLGDSVISCAAFGNPKGVRRNKEQNNPKMLRRKACAPAKRKKEDK